MHVDCCRPMPDYESFIAQFDWIALVRVVEGPVASSIVEYNLDWVYSYLQVGKLQIFINQDEVAAPHGGQE